MVAGFDAESVDTPGVIAGFGWAFALAGPAPRTGIPAAFRYSLTVSRRTPVARSIRRSGQPSRPSAQNLLLFVSSKTLLMPARNYTSLAGVNVLAGQLIAGFEVSINCRFWVSTEGAGDVSESR